MRNCEKQAGMQHAVKRQWIRRVFCDEFYQTVVKKVIRNRYISNYYRR